MCIHLSPSSRLFHHPRRCSRRKAHSFFPPFVSNRRKANESHYVNFHQCGGVWRSTFAFFTFGRLTSCRFGVERWVAGDLGLRYCAVHVCVCSYIPGSKAHCKACITPHSRSVGAAVVYAGERFPTLFPAYAACVGHQSIGMGR